MLKEVGDHALNYHERYVRPSKVFVAESLVKAKHKLLWDTLQKFRHNQRSAILDAFATFSIRSIAIDIYLAFEVLLYSLLFVLGITDYGFEWS